MVDVVVVGVDSLNLLTVPVDAQTLAVERHAVSVGVVEAKREIDLFGTLFSTCAFFFLVSRISFSCF